MKYQSQFENRPLVFNHGVAAIDAITLNGMATAAGRFLQQEIILPSVLENLQSAFFDDCMRIEMEPEKAIISATIDTGKMVWRDITETKHTMLIDYAGIARLAVSLSDIEVADINTIQVAATPLSLSGGQAVVMWFAEVPFEILQGCGYYGLLNLARNLSSNFKGGNPQRYDQIIVPAQQIDYERSMTEIIALNGYQLAEVKQIFKIGLDDTGARVQAETIATLGISPQPEPEPKIAIFGSNNPVVFWLTEPQDSKPFAIVASTSEAWLDPDQTVNLG